MVNVQSRVDDVNKAAKQLEESRHPRTKEIKECQTRLNKRYILDRLPVHHRGTQRPTGQTSMQMVFLRKLICEE